MDGSREPARRSVLRENWCCKCGRLSRYHYLSMHPQWSFGVTSWEVFSLGKNPYPGVDPFSLIRYLESGERLDKPLNEACSQEMWELLILCNTLLTDTRSQPWDDERVLECGAGQTTNFLSTGGWHLHQTGGVVWILETHDVIHKLHHVAKL